LFVSIMLICILTTSVFLCACDKDDDQDWIKIHNYSSFSLKYSNYSTKINSVEDITTLCDENSSPIFKKDSYDRNIDIITTLNEYDEEFFMDKSLIVLFRLRNGFPFYVKDFEIIDQSFNITLARDLPKEPVAYPGVFISSICVYILEFDKEKVKDVTQINVQEILIQK
ncbi:MAG: hypothetical protein K2I46_00020, partial [Clostridia bacterium]|nr:hypothetical protein [Clostridia bacterium]